MKTATAGPGRPSGPPDTNNPWQLRIGAEHYRRLYQHLFPLGQHFDEHGAVLAAGIVETARGTRLLVRDVFLAREGVDWLPGQRGYRMLTAEFVNEKIRFCRDQGLAYIAVHNHGGTHNVGFSTDDLRSHERGYPALLDIGRGIPVGALVFAEDAVAGDIWTTGGERRTVNEAVVVGLRQRRLRPKPLEPPTREPELYNRQALLFGAAGQRLLRDQKVGVIGAGGVGMIAVSHLARLGIGELVVIDPERVEISNLPRLPEATRWDAKEILTRDGRPSWLRRVGRRFSTPKVSVAERIARRASTAISVTALRGDVTEAAIAERLRDCDALILAADTQQARVVFNALVHQYLIPGWQIGSKIQIEPHTGTVDDVFSVVRPVMPDGGCLWCNMAINPTKLADEALTDVQRERQRYVDEVPAPSVITLNALGVAQATNALMLSVTGLARDQQVTHRYDFVRDGRIRTDEPRRDARCIDCGDIGRSRRARGDAERLPVR